jgi:hypothetical protein
MQRHAPHIPAALTSPSLNRGTAFTLDERTALVNRPDFRAHRFMCVQPRIGLCP